MTQETATLWQIGKPGLGDQKSASKGRWQEEFTYVVGSDQDPINQPQIPLLLVVSDPPARLKTKLKKLLSTKKLNIQFTLTQNYSVEELTLFYDFFGLETDILLVDGQQITQLVGVGEGKLRQAQISLPALSAGEHTLTLTTAGGVGDGGHWIDCFKLDGVVAPQQSKTPATTEPTANMNTTNSESTASTDATKKKSYVMTSMTGMQDYSYWAKYAREQVKKTKGGKKSFRRGRIWA